MTLLKVERCRFSDQINTLFSISLHFIGWTVVLCHATVGTLSVDKLLVLPFFELLDQLSEGSQLSRVDKVELIDEIYEMLKASIQVRLC